MNSQFHRLMLWLCVFQGIVCKSAKKKRGMTVGFVNFENGEQLKTAVEVFVCFVIIFDSFWNYVVVCFD